MKATAMGKLTRDDALSCSQLPALLGVDAYGKTPNDILRRCIQAAQGISDTFAQNEAMKWGSRLEEAIVEEAAERLGMELKHGFTEPFECSYAPLQCSLDAKITPVLNTQTIKTDQDQGIFVMTDTGEITVTGYGCLEAKLTSMAPEDSPPLHRGPLQLQGQMMCTGSHWGAIATLYRGTELRIFVFAEHRETQSRIEAAAKDFDCRMETWRHTGQEDWYPLQSAEDGSRTFSEIKRPITVDLPDDAETYVADLKRAAEMSAQADALKEQATKSLMDLIGDAEAGKVGHYLVLWGSRSYKAQPEKVTPAKAAYTVRSKTLSVKEVTA